MYNFFQKSVLHFYLSEMSILSSFNSIHGRIRQNQTVWGTLSMVFPHHSH